LIHERAPAKVNLVLQIGPVAPNGLHEVCSLFASLDLADDVEVSEADADVVICEGVEGPNLAEAAVKAFREALGSKSERLKGSDPFLEVTIRKRIPVAAGLGGGSADAAAVLRAANRIAGERFDADALREIAAPLGSDVPSQIEPRHSIVTGTGERVEAVDLPEMALVLVPSEQGLSTADVFREADRLGLARDALDPGRLRELAGAPLERIAGAMENDLQEAALSLRPELAGTLDALRGGGALGALVSGSGPTCFGVFADADAAGVVAAPLPGALVTIVARP
jgi:4-diphosphocytidyl-2-C-methyl-D-erythritol kinase